MLFVIFVFLKISAPLYYLNFQKIVQNCVYRKLKKLIIIVSIVIIIMLS